MKKIFSFGFQVSLWVVS